ncbi:response regulator transcription factor [Microbispora sp. RL4-1S]|uniref:Response regulator transcription factor n=1 Tax=Microbispora oryzae TaxID=2806554 RepID=A0A941AJH3_9ACTN|nr:response regulator transcription factor [Microbispora oryzae]MBP2706241.1 response regulator transcription factor [Microbispora oryzae]
MIRLLIADDDELTRAGLCALLSIESDLDVVAEAADGTEVLPMVTALRPDVVLMDVRMPALDGIQATRLLRAELTEPPKILVITTFQNDEYVYEALRAGANGFLLKRAKISQIAHAIRLADAGESLLFPDAIRTLVTAHLAPPVAVPRPSLTVRESEILRLMATGRSNTEIARTLVISLETVKTHVANIFNKLDAANRTQAVIIAYETGIVTPGIADIWPGNGT